MHTQKFRVSDNCIDCVWSPLYQVMLHIVVTWNRNIVGSVLESPTNDLWSCSFVLAEIMEKIFQWFAISGYVCDKVRLWCDQSNTWLLLRLTEQGLDRRKIKSAFGFKVSVHQLLTGLVWYYLWITAYAMLTIQVQIRYFQISLKIKFQGKICILSS